MFSQPKQCEIFALTDVVLAVRHADGPPPTGKQDKSSYDKRRILVYLMRANRFSKRTSFWLSSLAMRRHSWNACSIPRWVCRPEIVVVAVLSLRMAAVGEAQET